MNKKEIAKKINSFAMALVIMTPAYMIFLESLLNIERNNSLVIMAIIILIEIFISTILGRTFILNKISIGIVTIVSILYIFSINNFSLYSYSLIQFGFYFLVPAYILFQRLNIEDVIKYIIYLSYPMVLKINDMVSVTNVGLGQGDMYNIYAMVPFILASIVHFIHFRKHSTIMVKIGYILNIYYFLSVALSAVRGYFLVFIFYFFLELLRFLKARISKRKYYSFVVLVLFIAISGSLFLTEILAWGLNILQPIIGDDVSFIVKMSILLDKGDITNGRISLWQNAIECFMESPFWGHGFGGFYLWNPVYPYPHNFVLQLLTDGGILFGFIPIVVILVGLICIFSGKLEKEGYEGILFLSALSIPQLSLSGDIWKSAPLWMTVFFYCRYFFDRSLNKW